MAIFYIARSEIITPLPWTTFALPFSIRDRHKATLIPLNLTQGYDLAWPRQLFAPRPHDPQYELGLDDGLFLERFVAGDTGIAKRPHI